MSRTGKSKTKSRFVVASRWREGKIQLNISFGDDGNILEFNSRDGCITQW
jgi:predicted short-subunit dehydrogenase-like oxidoreductase (DUF2520 family)